MYGGGSCLLHVRHDEEHVVNYIGSYRLALRGVLFQIGPLSVDKLEKDMEAEIEDTQKRKDPFRSFYFCSGVMRSKLSLTEVQGCFDSMVC